MEMNKVQYPAGGCGIVQAGGEGGPSYEKASGDEERVGLREAGRGG